MEKDKLFFFCVQLVMTNAIIKMVPFMSGDRSKCHPAKTLLPKALAPRATMFFILIYRPT
jgi:hypothetical protein